MTSGLGRRSSAVSSRPACSDARAADIQTKRRRAARVRETERAIGQPMRVQARLRRQRRVDRRAFEPDEIDLAFVDGQGKRVVLHSRAATQISEHNDRGSHDVYLALILAGCVFWPSC